MTNESENETYSGEPIVTGGDKARAAAELGQKLKKAGAFPPKIGDTVNHELKHALADKGKGRRFRIVQREGLVVPSYQAEGKRTPQEKQRIALAPHKPSPKDFEIAQHATPPRISDLAGFFNQEIIPSFDPQNFLLRIGKEE